MNSHLANANGTSRKGHRARRGGRLQLEAVTKRFGDVVAVDDVTLTVEAGEFFSLLGASGCGKTTTLRLLGGFERLDSGRVFLDDQDLSARPPEKRNINTVFQNYALFPHMDVAENVRFGLQFTSLDHREQRRTVDEMLRLVRLEGYAHRRPSELSGGQQQRVALARALALRPALLLLDEPLGALDAQLREALQVELKALQEEVGITFIYVTHDQGEGLRMADRIAVMAAGRLEQVGTPEEIYEQPRNRFVAEFLGAANVITGTIVSSEGTAQRVRVGGGDVLVPTSQSATNGRLVTMAVRPERVEILPQAPSGDNCLSGVVDRIVYSGADSHVYVRLEDGTKLQARVGNWLSGRNAIRAGAAVAIRLPPESLRMLED